MSSRLVSLGLVFVSCTTPAGPALVNRVGTAGPLPAPPPRATTGSGVEGCFTREELQARTEQSHADDQAVATEALHQQGLEAVSLKAHVLVRGHGEWTGPPPAPHVETREVEGKRRVWVVVMPPTGGCGDLSGAFEFARAGARIWQVQRSVTTRRVDVTLCGCPGCRCEPPSVPRCGGAAVVADTILGYELPGDADFAGVREVRLVQEWLSVSRVLPPQPECAPDPQPP